MEHRSTYQHSPSQHENIPNLPSHPSVLHPQQIPFKSEEPSRYPIYQHEAFPASSGLVRGSSNTTLSSAYALEPANWYHPPPPTTTPSSAQPTRILTYPPVLHRPYSAQDLSGYDRRSFFESPTYGSHRSSGDQSSSSSLVFEYAASAQEDAPSPSMFLRDEPSPVPASARPSLQQAPAIESPINYTGAVVSGPSHSSPDSPSASISSSTRGSGKKKPSISHRGTESEDVSTKELKRLRNKESSQRFRDRTKDRMREKDERLDFLERRVRELELAEQASVFGPATETPHLDELLDPTSVAAAELKQLKLAFQRTRERMRQLEDENTRLRLTEQTPPSQYISSFYDS